MKSPNGPPTFKPIGQERCVKQDKKWQECWQCILRLSCRSNTTIMLHLTYLVAILRLSFSTLLYSVHIFGEARAITEKVSTFAHFENLPEIVHHPGTFGILISTNYNSEHTTSDLVYYLGWILGELGCSIILIFYCFYSNNFQIQVFWTIHINIYIFKKCV